MQHFFRSKIDIISFIIKGKFLFGKKKPLFSLRLQLRFVSKNFMHQDSAVAKGKSLQQFHASRFGRCKKYTVYNNLHDLTEDKRNMSHLTRRSTRVISYLLLDFNK